MILADTSVWVDYFRNRCGLLGELLRRNDILAHPFVIGEQLYTHDKRLHAAASAMSLAYVHTR
jgi:predicted nucleic acid-binding protein